MSPVRKRSKEPTNDASGSGSKGALGKTFDRVVSTLRRKGTYRPGENSHEEAKEPIPREDTMPEEDCIIPSNPSTTVSTPLSQAESCYSVGDADCTELMRTAELAELLGSAEVPAGPPPSNDTVDTMSSESSLGKRKASDVSELSGPPAFTRPRLDDPATTSPPQEEPIFIARHNEWILGLFKSLQLSTGVMWEIARYVSQKGELPGAEVKLLEGLKGNNAEAAPNAMKRLYGKEDAGEEFQAAFVKELLAKSPWEELDKEEAALRADEYAGLGFSELQPDYYGGKVVFRAHLKNTGTKAAPAYNVGTKTAPTYHLVLDAPELGPSSRFLRRFGSWNFMKVKVPKQVLSQPNNGLVDFFRRPLVLNGKVYRAYYAKESNVFLFRTNECVGPQDTIVTSKGSDCGPMSLLDFLNWHNPLDGNPQQAIQKWSSRFALGLSTSVPGLRLKPENILVEDDIISPQGSDMTDGSGHLNKPALLAMHYRFGWKDFPTAVQLRLKGHKGLGCLHPDHHMNSSEEYIACMRPSQTKIKYTGASLDPAMCIIDVLQSSHMRTPARLSAETITNLAENGVPHAVFSTLFREGLKAHVAPFTQWDGPDAMPDLWCHLAHVGGVMAARAARESAAEAKVMGYRVREPEEAEDEDDIVDSNITHERSTAWWGDEVSGLPSALEETCMVLLDSGHTPVSCAVLREKLLQVALKTVEAYTSRFKIDVPMSCSALLIPDPYECLGEDEIQVKSSRREFTTAAGINTDIILGNVLLTRNPCKLPTDTRKVNAVYKSQLANYTDVIVCSIKGHRRLADWLAGGDYDGDKGSVFYDPALVKPFTNADEKFSHEPEDATKDFTQQTQTVAHVMELVKSENPIVQTHKYQEYLLGAIQDTLVVGVYSAFHDYATYTLGYTHPETIRLNYMFCTLLDRFKNGRVLIEGVMSRDYAKYGKRPPAWKESKEDDDRHVNSTSNGLNPKRGHKLGQFIMDELCKQAKDEGNVQKDAIRDSFQRQGRAVVDPHLTQPWHDEEDRIARAKLAGVDTAQIEAELLAIKAHVQAVEAKYHQEKDRATREFAAKSRTRTIGPRRTTRFTDLPIEVRQDILRAAAKDFAARPSPDEIFMQSQEGIARLRASYAYLYDSEQQSQKWSRFPWDVCTRDLNAIKAHALGMTKTCTQDFYTRFTIKHSSFPRRR